MPIVAAACGGGDGAAPPLGPEDAGAPAVASVMINPSEQTVGMLGVTVEFAAGAYDADGSPVYGLRDDPERFSWSSSDPGVATVKGAAVTSMAEGTATITATVEGVTESVTVTVRDRARFAWSVALPAAIDAGNVMGADGTIYVGANTRREERSVWYAVSPQGLVLWTLDLPFLTAGQIPAIGDDGTLYLGAFHATGTEGGSLIAVDPAGTVRWMLGDLDGIRSSPAIGPHGTVYVAGRRRLYAVDPSGEIEWTFEREDDVFFFSSPAIARNGTVYVGGEDGLLYALAPDGSLRWTFATGDRIRSSPVIGTDGTIYVGSHDGRLHAVRPDGTGRWSVELSCGLPWGCTPVETSPSIGADGTIYVRTDGLFAVDPAGSIRWRSPAGNGERIGDAPILGADGTVYVAGLAPPGRFGIHVVDAEGERPGDYPRQGARGSPLIAFDGTIIAAAGNELVAIVEHQPTNGGYAASPWPTARGDRANTGRAGG